MTIELVNLKRQYARLRPEMSAAIDQVLVDAELIGGPRLAAFEKDFASFCGVANAVCVANGTVALEIALRALGVGPGAEVLVPAMTFIATSEAVRLVGAVPVFVDVDDATGTMDVAAAARAIGPRTRAVIAVHLYGRPAHMTNLAALCDRHGLLLVGDAAQAHGALHDGRPIASFGQATCYSFYPGKNLGAYGDGGAIVTDDPELAAAMRRYANHGRSDKYLHRELGTNARMDTLQAAVLSVKLPHLAAWNARRAQLAEVYGLALAGIDGLMLPSAAGSDLHVWHLYVVRVAPGIRDGLLAHLKACGIQAGIHYPIPLHLQPCNADLGCGKGTAPISEAMALESVSLPLCPELTDAEQLAVIAAVRSYLTA